MTHIRKISELKLGSIGYMNDLFKVFEQKIKFYFSIILKFKDRKCNVFNSLGMKQNELHSNFRDKNKSFRLTNTCVQLLFTLPII